MRTPRQKIPFDFIEFSLGLIEEPDYREACQEFIDRFLNDLEQGEIPDYPLPTFFRKRSLFQKVKIPMGVSMLSTHLSMIGQSYGMFAYIYDELAENITLALEDTFGRTGRYLEIMAGSGWLAEALAQAGLQGKYVATDLTPNQPVYPIKRMEAKRAIRKYKGADCYILSWPPYEDEAAAEAISTLPEGSRIIYMGEWYGNCGTPSLFEQLEVVETLSPLWQQASDSYLTWFALHDQMRLCRKVFGAS